jgi:hypothetical protein
MVFTVDSERMAGFGYKTGWLAFDGAGPDEIVAALGGRILGPHGWADGVERSYGEPDTVLITPRLPGAGDAGWILVAGNWIAEHADDLDTAALSAKLGGQVQLFVTHRVVELHRWERAADGQLVRSFEYVGERGEITRWYGQPHVVELSLGLPATDSRPDPTHSHLDIRVDEADVMRVAAAWSADPSGLDGQPATGSLMLASLSTARRKRRARIPLRRPVPIDITDLITSGRSFEDVNAEIGRRIRQQATWRQRILGQWRHHRSVRRVGGAE